MEDDSKANGMGRRQFLGMSAISAAALAMPLPGSAGRSQATLSVPPFASYRSLPPGAVKPEGWLALYLEKQAKQLGLHLPEISWPFDHSFWLGEEQAPSWWPWEQRGYWIDGALRCALVLGDQRLRRLAQAPVDYTVEHASPDGYLGPAYLKDAREDDSFRWPHTVFFRALAAIGEATSDPRIAAAMQKHYLLDHAPYGGPYRDVTNVEGMLWSYERTGDKRLLAMAEKAWNDFTRSAEPCDRVSGDLHPSRVLAGGPIYAHGVTYIEKAKLPAILYTHTGNEEYLRFALASQKRIFDHHMLIDGTPSTSEFYRTITALDSHETCDISDHTWTWGYLLMATGDGVWGDRIERACFNAGFGAIKKDWKAIQYFSCPNQVLATQTSSHVVGARGNQMMSYQPNPGHNTACCGGNVHRFFPNYVIRMWMTDANGGLVATLYGASKVTALVGGRSVEIRQDTDYPFGEEIHFTIETDNPVSFPLSLRIPSWCTAPSLFLNDKPILMPPIRNGFARLERTFRPSDKITLVLPMRSALSYWPDFGRGIEHGPLVYSLPIQTEWSPVVEPKWSTAEFPGWDALPASAWNYALGVEESKLNSDLKVERGAMSEDPWVEPPIALSLPTMKVPEWKLQTAQDGRTQLTPPLPTDITHWNKAKPEMIERIKLVPYGATNLRLTIFPKA